MVNELSGSMRRNALTIILATSLGACAAMEGVNLGANIPIGGVINVGANKTIGEQPAPAPSQKKPDKETDESESEDE